MANLSQQKRKRMLEFLNTLKEQHRDDDNTLIAINEIENEINGKKYGLVWEKHEEAVDVKMRTHIPVFTEVKDKEITKIPGGDYNFLIEGDNLHSLKLLEKTHRNNIDLIYIDPPYNTNNKDFIYDDKRIDKTDYFRHSKWLSFMERRLRIAKELLSKKGSIFISIDNNEQAELKMLCDEIFGEENFVDMISWFKKASPSNDAQYFSNDIEYILVYARNKSEWVINRLVLNEKQLKNYSNPDNDPRGLWNSATYTCNKSSDARPSLYYSITNPNTKEEIWPSKDAVWAYSYDEYLEHKKNNMLYWGVNGDAKMPRFKTFLSGHQGVVNRTLWHYNDVNHTQGATGELKRYGITGFDTPKPVRLIERILKIATQKDSWVLDFFAGTGTTGEAVMALNEKDGGSRKFILCTNNESNICEEKTFHRLNCVINGYNFSGKKKEVLFKKKLTVRDLKHMDDYLNDIEELKREYNSNNKSCKLSLKENVLQLDLEIEIDDKMPPVFNNLKYYRTDFIERNSDNITESLLAHVSEMIQLEQGINIDGENYILLLDEDSVDELFNHWNEYNNVKALYISNDVLLTTEQVKLFKEIPIYTIPDYYFNFELREAGEIW